MACFSVALLPTTRRTGIRTEWGTSPRSGGKLSQRSPSAQPSPIERGWEAMLCADDCSRSDLFQRYRFERYPSPYPSDKVIPMSDPVFTMEIPSNDSPPPDTSPDTRGYGDSATNSGTDFRCIVCGTGPLYYAGKGRHPKYCDDHRPKGSTPSSSKAKGGVPVDILIEQITQLYLGVSVGMTFTPYSMDGMVIADNASKLAESWRPLILRDPKIRKFWEKVCTGGGWGQVVFAHGMVAMQIAQIHGLSIPGVTPKPVPTSNTEGDQV